MSCGCRWVQGPIGPRGPPGQRGSPGPMGLPGSTGPGVNTTLFSGQSADVPTGGFFPNLVDPFVSSFYDGSLYLAGPNLYTLNTQSYDGNFSSSSGLITNYQQFTSNFGTNLNGTATIMSDTLSYYLLPINPQGMLVTNNNIYFVGYDLAQNYWFYQTDLQFNFIGAFPIPEGPPSYPVFGFVSLIAVGSEILFPSSQNLYVYSSGSFTSISTGLMYTFPQFYYEAPTAYLIGLNSSSVNQLVLLNTSTQETTDVTLPGSVTTFGLLNGTAFIAGVFSDFLIYNNGLLSALTNPAPSQNALYIAPLIFDSTLPQGYYASSLNQLVSIQTFSTTNFFQPITTQGIDISYSNPPSTMLQDDSGTIHIPYYGVYHYFREGIDQQVQLLLDSTHLSGNTLSLLQYDSANHRMLTVTYYPNYASQSISIYSDQEPALLGRVNIGYDPAQIQASQDTFYVIDQTSANVGLLNASGATNIALPFLRYNYLVNPIDNYHGSALSSEGYLFVPTAGYSSFNLTNGTGQSAGYLNIVTPSNEVLTLTLPSQPQSSSAVTVSPVTQRVYFEYGDTHGTFIGYSDPPYSSYDTITTTSASYGLYYVNTTGSNDVVYDLVVLSNQPTVQSIVGNQLGPLISLPGANVTNQQNVVSLSNEIVVNFGNLNVIGVTNLNVHPTAPIAGFDDLYFALVGTTLIALQGTTEIYNLSLNTDTLSLSHGTTGSYYVGNGLQVSEYSNQGLLIKNWVVPQSYTGNAVSQVSYSNSVVAVTLPSNVPGQTNESYSVILLNINVTNTVQGTLVTQLQSNLLLITVPTGTTFVANSDLVIDFIFPVTFSGTVISVASLTPFENLTFDQVTGNFQGSNLVIEGVVNTDENTTLTRNTTFTFLVSYV